MKKPAKIIMSPYSGFCFGVERAINIAKKALSGRRRVYSLGPIIHNPEAVEDLSKKGLEVIESVKGLDRKKAALLIPSHGADPRLLKKLNFKAFDTTCPRVRRVQDIVREFSEKGYFIVIVGKKDHPEVRSLTGIAGRNSVVVTGAPRAKKLKFKSKKVVVLSQTTSRESDFLETLREVAKKKFLELVAFNTVCEDSIKRQGVARDIAKKVDVMLVIGGKNSSNTSKLKCACYALNKKTYHVESAVGLERKIVKNKGKIGIATGASTPPEAVRKTVERIRRIEKE